MKSLASAMTVIVLTWAGLAHADVYMLDVQINGSPTQSGWTAVSGDNRFDNSTAVDLGNGVKVGAPGWAKLNGRNRTGTPNMPVNFHDYDALLVDFGNPSGTGFAGSALEIRGLAAGTWTLKIISGDPDYPVVPDTMTLQGVQVSLVGYNKNAASLDDLTTTFHITLTAGENIVIGDIDSSNTDNGKIAGIILEPFVAAPEPATLGLLALGGLGLIGGQMRRRRG
ncbi:MAG: hypothetical protein BIFFINMI_03846 [Phycisphaerae bacterium]|nr:hypothetical protein [Phycisphaerae bacterium]